MSPENTQTDIERTEHRTPERISQEAQRLDSMRLRELCLECGADDVGFVSLDHPEIADQRSDILQIFPATRSLISFVCKMNREPIRSTARSVANLEFHHAGDKVNDVGREIVARLEARGVRALNPAMGFPMEMDRFPGKIWVVSHKPVAVAAGLGHMGIHRNVIHPKFGNFILLGTILLDSELSEYGQAIDFNPCLECKLCVAACPTGAIGTDGYFDFSACYTHNYREFMGGFHDWTETVAASKSSKDYRKQVTLPESASMWQSLSFGANYKAAYCMSVCPAGEDVISPYRENKKQFLQEIVKPLQHKRETVYVTAGSDAEKYVGRHFPHKNIKRVRNGLTPQSVQGFLEGLPIVFQRQQAAGIEVTYHFELTGEETLRATVRIERKTVTVTRGHVGRSDIKITADTRSWLRFLSGDSHILPAILLRKIRIKGPLRLMKTFAKCFPV